MKVRIDYNRCIGALKCVEICPEVFEPREDGLAEVKIEVVPEELCDKVKEAAEECPTQAVIMEPHK